MQPSAVVVVGIVAFASVATRTNDAAPRPDASPLGLEDRVAARRAVERVYWQHRIWPAENPGPKPSFAAALPDGAIRAKVEDVLKKSAALEMRWHVTVTAAELQAELERMARNTRARDVLRELFDALGNDARLVAETLARPAVVDRRIRSAFEREAGSGSFDAWWASERSRVTLEEPPEVGRLHLPPIDSGGCVDDTWKSTFKDLPDGRGALTAVWTGSEMIVWGGTIADAAVLQTGGRYDPATDRWEATSTDPGVPTARTDHTAVWTGSEMIVWGGRNRSPSSPWLNTGSRYNPLTDTWTPTSSGANVPSPRYHHTAVWTGTQMIVWGGGSTGATAWLATGARYDPTADSWNPTSTASGVPAARRNHSAVWTGARMIVWGGDAGGGAMATGGLYDPGTDSWTPTSTGPGNPAARSQHVALWTGTEMIVWGGFRNDGARYDPVSGVWTPMSVGAGVPSARGGNVAVWTGTSMLVWGGRNSSPGTPLGDGARYDVASDSWTPIAVDAATPSARKDAAAAWTGTEMIVWGGSNFSNNGAPTRGGRYDPIADAWSPTSVATVVPRGGWQSAEAWTGAELIVCNGRNEDLTFEPGCTRYDPATDHWTTASLSPDGPQGGSGSALWSGREALVFGQTPSGAFGGRYDPATDSWRPISQPGFATGNRRVWSGTEAISWGGNSQLIAGARYNPTTDTWRPTSTGAGVPSPRSGHVIVWAGREMIIWGGVSETGQYLNDGARYDPANDSWMSMPAGAGTPSPRINATGVWTGSELIIWGGTTTVAGTPFNSGARYAPATNLWTSTSTGVNCPSARSGHAAVWSGAEMIVWGSGPDDPGTGGRYDPATDTWRPTSTGAGVPSKRTMPTTLWTGREMIFWGGDLSNFTTTGTLYCACPTGRLIYRDADGDGYGDPAVSQASCDGSTIAGYVVDASDCRDDLATVHPGVVETCNALDDDCNGLVDDDAVGEDSDRDTVHNRCDNCPAVSNATQNDFDADAEGDACDLDDGLIYVFGTDRDHIAWQQEIGPTSWNVYEGDLSVLRSSGIYTQAPGSNGLAQRTCGASVNSIDDLEPLPPGSAKFSLVTGVTGGIEGSLGTNSYGTPRPNANPCP